MGVTTDFFVASPDELKSVMRNWLPVAEKPIKRKFQNSFTGEMELRTYWPPSVEPPKKIADKDLYPRGYQNVLYAEYKNVDHVKLTKLNVILAGGEFENRFMQFKRPALLDPRLSESTGLHRFDDKFVNAITAITGFINVAKQWAKTEEMRGDRFTIDDCGMVLCDLIRLANHATRTRRGFIFTGAYSEAGGNG